MKLSNKILWILVGIFCLAYLSNMVFHVVNMKKAETTIGKDLTKEGMEYIRKNKEDQMNVWTTRVNVVCVNNKERTILNKFRVEGNINYINIVNKQQRVDFYKNIRLHYDTLFVSEKAAYVIDTDPIPQQYYIGLPNVKELYWNGKLVRRF